MTGLVTLDNSDTRVDAYVSDENVLFRGVTTGQITGIASSKGDRSFNNGDVGSLLHSIVDDDDDDDRSEPDALATIPL